MSLPTTTIRKPWRDWELSCSGEVDVSHLNLRRKRVWWPCGPAREQFDTEIVPGIEEWLRNVNLVDEADIYLRLYMIGKSQRTVRPVIMVCCTNAQVKDQVEKEIRESPILRQHPTFGLGSSLLPLDQQGPIQPLAGTSETGSISDSQSSEDSSSWLGSSYPYRAAGASPVGPLIGRRIRIADELGTSSPSRLVTGGVIIQIAGSDSLYQLTASHEGQVSIPVSSLSGLDQCHFDGMDDEDEEEDEREVESAIEHMDHGLDCHSTPTASQPLGVQGDQLSMPSERPFICPQPPDPQLDYAIIPLSPSEELIGQWQVNTITLDGEDNSRTMQIRRVAHIGSEERKIIAITGSCGVTPGVLMPVPLYFRTATLLRFQALYSVHLQGPVTRGDSGSAVVDEVTGDLYGHIVRGTPGSGTAYIVAAVEVLEDLARQTQSSVHLAVPSIERGFLAAALSVEPALNLTEEFSALDQPNHFESQADRRPHHAPIIEDNSLIVGDRPSYFDYPSYFASWTPEPLDSPPPPPSLSFWLSESSASAPYNAVYSYSNRSHDPETSNSPQPETSNNEGSG